MGGFSRGATVQADGEWRRHDAQSVVLCLEQAGMTHLALRSGSPYPSARMVSPVSIVRSIRDGDYPGDMVLRPAVPSSREIDIMTQRLSWIELIPKDRVVIRRVVNMRLLVDPLTSKHLVSWRRAAIRVKANHRAVIGWHEIGIGFIVRALVDAKTMYFHEKRDVNPGCDTSGN